LYIGYLASKEYDNSSFLGLKQVKDYFQKKIKENKEFYSLKTTGLLGIVRHPYYLSALILLWARPMYIKDLIINIVFTIYFITGALNEERKLVGIFNDEYISYRRNVPMLIPDIKELVIFLVKNIKNPRHQKESEDL
jgi:protein-S-isoprenylcysteine O-methyltransferase Ste14